MSSIVINVPDDKKTEYKFFIHKIIENYSPTEIKEILESDLDKKSLDRLKNIDKLNFVDF